MPSYSRRTPFSRPDGSSLISWAPWCAVPHGGPGAREDGCRLRRQTEGGQGQCDENQTLAARFGIMEHPHGRPSRTGRSKLR